MEFEIISTADYNDLTDCDCAALYIDYAVIHLARYSGIYVLIPRSELLLYDDAIRPERCP